MTDFDEHTPPPIGTLRDVAERHGCGMAEAARIMGAQLPGTSTIQPAKFSDVGPSRYFRHDGMIWKKRPGRDQVADLVHDGVETAQGRAWFSGGTVVETMAAAAVHAITGYTPRKRPYAGRLSTGI